MMECTAMTENSHHVVCVTVLYVYVVGSIRTETGRKEVGGSHALLVVPCRLWMDGCHVMSVLHGR